MSHELISEGERLDAAIEELEREHAVREVSGWHTGFDGLTGALDGMQPGLYVLVGPPGSGKTGFARQLLDQVARDNRVPGIFFTFADSAKELRIKTLARLSQIETSEIRRGSAYLLHWYGVPKSHHAEASALAPSWEKLTKLAEEARSWLDLIYLVECDRDTGIEEIVSTMQETRARTQAQSLLAVIDDAQRLDLSVNSAQVVSEKLQQLGVDLSVAILAVWPDLQASGAWAPTAWTEFFPSADVILLLQPDRSGASGEPQQSTTLHVVKNRRGERGKLIFSFQPAFARFTETSPAI